MNLTSLVQTVTNEDGTLSPAQRMAMLKELTSFEPGGTINETKRAQALLRSLAQGRDYRLAGNDMRPDQIRTRPAVGRSVLTANLGPTSTGKTTEYDISFFGKRGVDDQPFAGDSRNSKAKALNYMLGQAMDRDIPNNSMLKIEATDSRRVNAYERGTKGALKFGPFPWSEYSEFRARIPGGQATSYKNKAGNFQPIVDGKFTKSAKNPGDSLRGGLIRAATALDPIYRGVRGVFSSNRARGVDPISAIMTGADIGTWMQNNLKINKSTSGRGGGRKALND
jgi:hypothetical protein